MKDNNTVSQDTIEGIDDFIPMPGADAVVTGDAEQDGEGQKSPSDIFKREKKVDLSFLDEKEKNEDSDDDGKEDKNKDSDDKGANAGFEDQDSTGAADDVIASLDNQDFGTDSDDDKPVAGDQNFVTAMKSLIEDETIIPFDDDKDIADYSKKDWQELIKANFEEREKALRESTPKEFFEALPEELQYAAMHVAKGNTNLKDVFAALARREEVRELDVTNSDHQAMIARQYLQATNFGSGDNELIEDQVKEWIETGNIDKKAKQFKPKLDKMQEKILEADLKKQEEAQQRQVEQKEAYMKNIYETLKPAELNGIKLTSKRQNMLWNELTTIKYQSMTGKPTNLLGKLLEDYQFSDNPRYDLIAEATWLLQDPEDYKASIRAAVEREVAGDTAKKLKTEEGRRLRSTSSASDDQEDKSRKAPKKRGLSRKPGNIFKR
jgi:hypothetical protein